MFLKIANVICINKLILEVNDNILDKPLAKNVIKDIQLLIIIKKIRI